MPVRKVHKGLSEDERLVEDWLRDRYGLTAQPFSREKLGREKTPDFTVMRGDRLVFYCEVKTIEYDPWFDRTLRSESLPEGTIVGDHRVSGMAPQAVKDLESQLRARSGNEILRVKGGSHRRIANGIQEAVAQFTAVNPNHAHPNVLFFVNHDRLAKYSHLEEVAVRPYTLSLQKRFFRQFHQSRLDPKNRIICLYVWWDRCEDGGEPQFVSFGECQTHLCTLPEVLTIEAATSSRRGSGPVRFKPWGKPCQRSE